MAGSKRRRPTPAELGSVEADRDILDQYFSEVGRFPLLAAEEERSLARRIRRGDDDATAELVRRNLRFVVSVAKKYQNRGLPLVDLIGEGNVGLMTAARKFDPDQGVKFISYAVWWIRQAILAALAKHGRTVRIPLNRTADLSRVMRATAMLRERLRREPTVEEVSEVTGISTEIAQALGSVNTADVRLDVASGDDNDRALIERFAIEEVPSVEDEVIDQFRSAELERALATLPARDARILRLYFGIDGDREHTLDEIGKMLGVTRERVRQLRDRALKRLGQGPMGQTLKDLSAA
jgi:RNA polymerase primary sigma factor